MLCFLFSLIHSDSFLHGLYFIWFNSLEESIFINSITDKKTECISSMQHAHNYFGGTICRLHWCMMSLKCCMHGLVSDVHVKNTVRHYWSSELSFLSTWSVLPLLTWHRLLAWHAFLIFKLPAEWLENFPSQLLHLSYFCFHNDIPILMAAKRTCTWIHNAIQSLMIMKPE